MFMKKRTSLAISALLGLSALVAVPGQVFGQDEQIAEDDELLEEVIVTGSRIQRDGFTSSSPVSIFDEQEITMAGNASIDEFLKYVPQFTGYQMGMSTNNGSDRGQKKIDMRGLGFNRTLVLMNGRRTIGDAAGDGAVDINTIPEAMIQRVEVLTDGASSVYGSDALAGVVNFILHDEFEGLRITARYGGGTEDWDAEDYGLSILGGTGSDRGHIVYSVSWMKQEELLQGQRDWAFDALYPQLQADGTFKAVGSGSSNSRRIRTGATGNFIFDSGLGQARPFEASDVYNYAPVNALMQPNERYQFATIGKIEINDNIEGYFEGVYTRRFSQQRLAPDASFAVNSAVETPNNGFQWNDFVPANNPFNPFGSVNCANTIGLCGIDVRINRRFTESGGRLFAQSNDTYRLLAGFRGELTSSIDYDFFYVWAEAETIDETKNYGRFDRWAIAVDPVACAASAACPGVLNPFGDFGSITPEQMAYLTTGSLKDLVKSQMQLISFNFTGELGNLGGGAIGWAAGYEHRKEKGSYNPDEFLSEGLTTGGAADPLEGRFSVDEVYAEVFLPFTETFSADASFRWSDYDSVNSATTTFKLGADWEVFENFRLRATYGTGFRAPNISELNTSLSATFPLVATPCEFGDRSLAAGEITQTTWDNCQAAGFDTSDAGEFGFAWQSYYEFFSTGNLKPEESDTGTIGFVWAPDFGLQLSMDYFNIKVEDVIGVPDFNQLFNSCLASENFSNPSCDAFDEYGINFFGFPGDAIAEFGNLGTLKTDGVDIAISYAGDFGGSLGWRASVDATWVNSYESGAELGGSQDLVGTADNFSVFPEWKAWLQFGLMGDAWTADVMGRWIDATDDRWKTTTTTADAKVESMFYIDLVGTYEWNFLRITAGVNNVFDDDPPYFHSAFNANTEPGMYDVIGRRFFTSVTLEW
jgi:iron complex outermembrane receptor protein